MNLSLFCILWASVALVLLWARFQIRLQPPQLSQPEMLNRLRFFLTLHFRLTLVAFFGTMPLLLAMFWFILSMNRMFLDGPWALIDLDGPWFAPVSIIIAFFCSVALAGFSLFLLLIKVIAWLPSCRGFEQFCALTHRTWISGQGKGEQWESYVARVRAALKKPGPNPPIRSLWNTSLGTGILVAWLMLGPCIPVLASGYCKFSTEGIAVNHYLTFGEVHYAWQDITQVDARIIFYTQKGKMGCYPVLRITTQDNSEIHLRSYRQWSLAEETWFKASQFLRDSGTPVQVPTLTAQQKMVLGPALTRYLQVLSEARQASTR